MADDPLTAAEALAEILAEIQRRARLRRLVKKAGFSPASAARAEWLRQSELSRAVGLLAERDGAPVYARDLRQFLQVEGWVERQHEREGRQWRARRRA